MKDRGCNSGSARLLSDAQIDAVCADIAAYYAGRIACFGAHPLGVDWSCKATQSLRFAQLLKVCPSEGPLSLIDLGCGYGALATFLAARRGHGEVDYLGLDVASEMVRRGRRRHRGNDKVRFAVGRSSPQTADYVVASGIMNVKLGIGRPTWEGFVRTMLLDMHRMARRGFAVNFLTRPGRQSMPGQLYCTTPAKWVRFCERELDCSVEILDDYGMDHGMHEFTLLARTPNAASASRRIDHVASGMVAR